MKKKITKILLIIMIIEIALINILSAYTFKKIYAKNNQFEKRLSELEEDYKFHEINLNNLKKNAKAQFCND